MKVYDLKFMKKINPFDAPQLNPSTSLGMVRGNGERSRTKSRGLLWFDKLTIRPELVEGLRVVLRQAQHPSPSLRSGSLEGSREKSGEKHPELCRRNTERRFKPRLIKAGFGAVECIKGFTLLEIIIIIVICAILISAALIYYTNVVRQAEDAQAISHLGEIRKAEIFEIATGGSYVNASDAEEIEEKLELDVNEQYFTYKIENVTADDFVAIAERKEEKDNAPIMIAMNSKGDLKYYFSDGSTSTGSYPSVSRGGGGYSGGSSGGYSGGSGGLGDTGGLGGGGSGSTGGGGGSSGGGSSGSTSSETSGGTIGDTSGGGGDSGGGDSGGSSGGETGGDTGGDTGGGDTGSGDEGDGSGTPIEICGNGTCGGIETCSSCAQDCGECDTGGAVVDAALLDAYNALKDSTTGAALGALLDEHSVTITIGDAAQYGALAYWSPSENKLVVDAAYFASASTNAIAAILAHEATHADYTYNPDEWIADTLERHSELEEWQLHITQWPYDSIDQEYNAFKASAEVWEELKQPGDSDEQIDYWYDWFEYAEATGQDPEEVVKPAVRLYYDLPEY